MRTGIIVRCVPPLVLLLCAAGARGQTTQDWRKTKPFENSLGMLFRQAPAGSYVAGPKGMAQHDAMYETGNPSAGIEAKIEKAFYLCIHATRVRDYRAFCKATGHAEPKGEIYDPKTFKWIANFKPLSQEPMDDKTLALPVTCVTYDDALAFCKWLSEKEGRVYRLPTEIEWEYAARAGSDKPYQWFDKFDIRKVNGNLGEGKLLPANPEELFFDAEPAGKEESDDGSGLVTKGETALLGKYPANAWGFYHMLGNVQQFVVLTREPPKDGVPFPCWTALPGKVNRMLRGGSWLHDERDCTVFRANFNCPPYSNATIGFRVLLEDIAGR